MSEEIGSGAQGFDHPGEPAFLSVWCARTGLPRRVVPTVTVGRRR